MTKMSVTPATANFGSHHAVTTIVDLDEVHALEGPKETWPATSRFEFCIAEEERQTTADASICSRPGLTVVLARVRALGARLAGHSIGLGV
mgnify:CR=1 FL=1